MILFTIILILCMFEGGASAVLEVVERKFNQWWFVAILFGIMLFVILGIYKVIK